jgi:hypothetical protein
MIRTHKTVVHACGCETAYTQSGGRIGFLRECPAAMAVFAKYAGQPETREVTAARVSDFDAHLGEAE